MSQIENMVQKMMRSFDLNDDNVREMQNDLCGIVLKVDANALGYWTM